MGDADIHHQAEDEEEGLGDRLDDLQEGLEEEIDVVYEMLDSLDKRTEELAAAARFHSKLWHAFLAFNVLVIPAIIGLAFGFFTADIPLIPEAKTMRNMILAMLATLSGVIGLPLYFYRLWDMESIHRKKGSDWFISLDDDEQETDEGPVSADSDYGSSSSEIPTSNVAVPLPSHENVHEQQDTPPS